MATGTPTVSPVSGASPTRAAVFTSSPQSVEIFERGAWWPGSMLGWRHDSNGACQAWVRVEFAGVSEDAWVDLALLRLPESPAARSLTLAREPKGAARGAEAPSAASRAASGDPAQTQHLPLVRDTATPPAGRRVPPAGGRRRAPDTEEAPAVPAAPLGRHRAPAELGRHRAADTGMPTAVPAGNAATGSIADAVDRWAPPPPRSELPPAGPVIRPPVVRPGLDPDMLTRPMRLDEGVGSARRSRRDSLTGV